MKETCAERLESIKEAHKSAKTDYSRIEDHLEVISELVELKWTCKHSLMSQDISQLAPVCHKDATKACRKRIFGI